MRSPDAKRVTMTLDPDEYQRLAYWSARKGVSINEYLHMALGLQIQWDNQDYNLPAAEIQRLNQLVDAVSSLCSNMHSLEQVVTSGFNSLLGLTRGDNYLLDDDPDLYQ